MVSFRSRIGDDGTSTIYEAYVPLFPSIEDQESIVVSIVPDPAEQEVTKEECWLVYEYNEVILLELDQIIAEFDNGTYVTSWNMFDNPDNIQVRQDPKEKYEEVDPLSSDPPIFDTFPICHGVLVQFTDLELPVSFSIKVFADNGSLFLNETGEIEP